jgi:hypothetical protein
MPTFTNIDEAEVVIDGQAKYLYHFFNRGEAFMIHSMGIKVTDYVDCHHVMEAIISAESFDEAQNILIKAEISHAQQRYHFDVYLTGVDLVPSRENPIIMISYKQSVF